MKTVPEARARQDQSIKGYKGLLKLDLAKAQIGADGIIKNTYRRLMTRGMKGCYVYCTDPETATHFRRALATMDQHESGPGPLST